MTLLSIALGTALVLAIDLANATATASFARSVNVISDATNLQVVGIGHGFDERAYPRITETDGVLDSRPLVEGTVVVGARVGDPFSGEVLHIIGTDTLSPLPVDTVASGPPPIAPSPDTLINHNGAIITEKLAARMHVHVGSVLHALSGDREISYLVAGILPRAYTQAIDSDVVFVDVATAQDTLAKVGKLDRVDLVVAKDRLAGVQSALARVVPPGTRIITPGARSAEVARLLQGFRESLQALSLVSLVVGFFLVANTVAISVVRRRSEIGILRALGASRRSIVAAFLGEGALLGAAGAFFGCIAGAAVASLSVGAVSRTVDSLYISSHADSVIYDPTLILKAFVLGTIAAIAASLLPAIDAAGTRPASLVRAGSTERRDPSRPRKAALLAGVCAIGALLCGQGPKVWGLPLFGYASGLFVIAGGVLISPICIAFAASLLRRSSERFGVTTLLAASNLSNALVRNAIAVGALATAIGMTASISILIDSFRTTVVAWADDTLRADIFVRPLGLVDASDDTVLSPGVLNRIARLPNIAAVDAFRAVTLPYKDRLITLGAAHTATVIGYRGLRFLEPVDPALIAHELATQTAVIASEPFATRFGVHPNDRITLTTPSGPIVFTILATYRDYSSDAGFLLMDRDMFIRDFHDPTVNSIAVYAKPGTDIEKLHGAVARAALPEHVDVQSTGALRGYVTVLFDRTFAVTNALYFISIAIAVLGVANALFALVIERRREYGVLRLLGLSTGGLQRTVLIESAAIGVLGGGIGVVTGVFLAVVLVYSIDKQTFGWSITWHVPYPSLVEAFVLSCVAAVLAGISPARIAARIRTADVLRDE